MKKTIIFILILIILVLGFLFFTQKKDQENQVIPSQEFEITTNYIDEEDEERIISILYPSVGIEQIDKEIKEYVDSEANTFKEMEYISFSGAKYILDIDYFPVKFNDDIISFKFNKSDYTGGAHGNQYIACFTYNIKENKRLYLNDFFSSETYLDKISEFSYK
jgi:outer membrane lipoprotein-sorting protein